MEKEFPQELLVPRKTVFKKCAALQLGSEALEFGQCGLIVHGGSLEKSKKKDEILGSFPSEARVETFCRGNGEPTLDEITEAVCKAKELGAQWIAGIGGGSVLDLAKAAAGLFNASEPPAYYQEGGKLEEAGIPFVAVPTTAGTGAEATPNAVITNVQKQVKLSIRDKSFLAQKVLLDPDLLRGMPKTTLSYSGMDAFVQGYEAFTSRNATRFTDTLALRAMMLINDNLVQAYESPDDANLSALLIGSYYAGVALAHARLGVIHGIAHSLGVLYHQPHGLVCAVSLVPSIQLNREAMGKKYEMISEALGRDFIERSEQLINALSIVSPFKGKPVLEEEKIVQETLSSGSTAANPRPIDRCSIEFLLKKLF